MGCSSSVTDLPRFRLLRIDLSFPRTSSFSSCLLCTPLPVSCVPCSLAAFVFLFRWLACSFACSLPSGAFCSVAASGLEPSLGLFPVPSFVLSSLGHLVFGFLSQQPASEIRTCFAPGVRHASSEPHPLEIETNTIETGRHGSERRRAIDSVPD